MASNKEIGGGIHSVPAKREANAVQRIFDTIPRDEIILTLMESGDPQAISLAERMSDEKHRDRPLALLCFEAKILPKTVWKLLIDSRRLEASIRLSSRLGEIVEAVADASLPQILECPKCNGRQTVPGKKEGSPDVTCPLCSGVGSVVKPPDKDSQKMALEMGEMLNLKVPLIAQQFNSYQKGGSQDAGAPDMSDWTRSTDAIFEEHSKSDIIDVEVIDAARD